MTIFNRNCCKPTAGDNKLLSILPTDPTFTVDNVTRVMNKIKPEEREEVWKRVLSCDPFVEEIQKQHVPEEWESTYADVYVNCCSYSSWEDLAKQLYCRDQMAAVEELRPYLPPRGESSFCIVHMSHIAK